MAKDGATMALLCIFLTPPDKICDVKIFKKRKRSPKVRFRKYVKYKENMYFVPYFFARGLSFRDILAQIFSENFYFRKIKIVRKIARFSYVFDTM